MTATSEQTDHGPASPGPKEQAEAAGLRPATGTDVPTRVAVGVLSGVVVANLWLLRHLRRTVTWPNDLDFHSAMVRWASGQYRRGRVPFDGWFPTLSAGLPQFHHYQSLPHLIAGALGVAVGPEQALHHSLWLLVATWPIAVYIGGRALGLTRIGALGAAVAAPLVRSATGYGFEPFSSLWIGNGLWSQAWGMWVAPLAIGWTARTVRTGEHRRRAIAATGLTLALHLPTGWFVLLSVGLWVVVAPSEWRVRLGRAVGVGVRSALAGLWVVVPFLVDRWATNDSAFNGQGSFADSFGWRRVMGWTLAGDLIDAGRVPVLSVIAAAGLGLALHRWGTDRRGEREIVVLFAASLVLFIGRDPFGPLIGLVPGSSQVFLHRYISILQLASIWLIGIAVDQAWAWAHRQIEARDRAAGGDVAQQAHRRAALALGGCLIAAVVLAPAARSTNRLVAEDRSWVAAQAVADATSGADARTLVEVARRRGGGRMFAGRLNGQVAATVGQVSLPIWFAHEGVDAVGFTLRISALSADLETYLDERSIADLDAFGVRWVLLQAGTTPVPGTVRIAASGRYELWEVPGDGLVFAADPVGPVAEVDNDELAARLLPIMRAQGWSPDEVRPVVLEGRSPQAPVAPAGRGSPGRVSQVVAELDDGRVDAEVDLDRPAVVVVKANYHPRWKAQVDGVPARVSMVAPTWMAVEVPSGRHRVAFTYQPWPFTPHLLVLALLAVVGPPIRRRRRSVRAFGEEVLPLAS